MRDSSRGGDDRGNLERMGEATGAIAGRAADFGMEVTGALFRSASEMLGGWWSSDAPKQAATGWNDQAERSCRSHYETSSAGQGATQATHAAPKSSKGAMQAAGESTTTPEGEVALRGSATIGDTAVAGEAATDGFASARASYQLGYVARRNPDYSGRSFSEVEPELQRVWESRSRTEGSSSSSSSTWPEVRGFVDFAYQQDD